MGLVLTVTAGLVVWIVLWALGAKGFDAFMLATAIIVVGATLRIALRLPARPSQLSARAGAAGLPSGERPGNRGGADRASRPAAGASPGPRTRCRATS